MAGLFEIVVGSWEVVCQCFSGARSVKQCDRRCEFLVVLFLARLLQVKLSWCYIWEVSRESFNSFRVCQTCWMLLLNLIIVCEHLNVIWCRCFLVEISSFVGLQWASTRLYASFFNKFKRSELITWILNWVSHLLAGSLSIVNRIHLLCI